MEQKFRQIRKLVKSILTADIKSRCSDKWLYTKFLEMSEIDGLTATEKQQLIYLLRKAHLPKFASVMRVRQKLQAEQPSLSEAVTKKQRRKLEEEYRKEFSKYGKQKAAE